MSLLMTPSKITIPLLDLALQHKPLEEELNKAFLEVLNSRAFVLGPFVERFESDLAGYLDISHAIALNSGTDALILGLKALGVGPGDEVITVPNSFFATVEGILHVGARPVFVDVDPQTALMDVNGIPARITSRTKALLPVHLYGQPASMGPILEMAKRYRLWVVEDACQAMGSTYQGRKAGTLGDVGCFSFYPGKNLGALGDGGALVTRHPEVAEKVRKLRNHGGIRKYEHDLNGYNSRLDALQARFLSVKLHSLDQWNQARRRAASCYRKELRDTKDICSFQSLEDRLSNEHLFVVQVPSAKRDVLKQRLEEKGIETGIHYPTPLHHVLSHQGLYNANESFPVSERLSRSILSLPMYPELALSQIREVAETLKKEVAALS